MMISAANTLPATDGGDGYVPRQALLMAHLSQAAYLPPEDGTTALKALGFGYVQFIENVRTGTQAYIGVSEGDIAVAFRGTEANRREDRITDIKFVLARWIYGRVHLGFVQAVDSVWCQLSGNLLSLLHNRHRRLWITGHSLGAALATLFTTRWTACQHREIAALYTFGSPRVGDAAFAAAMDANLYGRHHRIVNNNDIVTRLPPPGLLGFRHCGTLHYLDRHGRRHVDPDWWKILTDRYGGLLERPADNLLDHGMSEYVEALRGEIG